MDNNQELQTGPELAMLNANSNTKYLGVSEAPDANDLFDKDGPKLQSNSPLEEQAMSQVASTPITENNHEVQVITQRLVVQNSQLVAELVGRKGWKIRDLQEQTNTYIRTPARGEDHIFIITGRPQGVAAAKRMLAAEAYHLTQLRAPRTNSMHNQSTQYLGSAYGPFYENGPTTMQKSPYITQCVAIAIPIYPLVFGHIIPNPAEDPSFVITGRPDDVATAQHEVITPAQHVRHEDPISAIRPEDAAEARRDMLTAAECITHTPAPPEIIAMQNGSGHRLGSSVEDLITIDVRVPRRAVAFVVGDNGSRIRRIQELTSTCIVTPLRAKPCFEAMEMREGAEPSKPEMDSNVAKGTEGSVTDHSHSKSEYSSPRLQQLQPHRLLSPPSSPYFGIAEGGSINGAPLDNLPLDATPHILQGNGGRTLDDVATAEHKVVTASEHIRHEDARFVITGRPKDVAEAKREVLTAAECITNIPASLEHDDPKFVITGRPEDVAEAKREVLTAAECKAPLEARAIQNERNQCRGFSVEDIITINVRVPRSAVAFIVGCKGARIKRIQEMTSTCIISPSKE